jgi:hypothetical protein
MNNILKFGNQYIKMRYNFKKLLKFMDKFKVKYHFRELI